MRSATLNEEREQLIEIVLGILHHGIVRVAGERQWIAHDIMQAFRLSVREHPSLSQNDSQAQDTIEGSDIEGLLCLQHLLRSEIMLPLGHASFSRILLGPELPSLSAELPLGMRSCRQRALE